MEKVKTIKVILAAIYTLISAALTVIKFIEQVGRMRTQEA
jgi:hypothetical protein